MKRKPEVWRQTPEDPDLWLGEHGVLVNAAALDERTYYVEIVRLPLLPVAASEPVLEDRVSLAG